MRKTCHKHKFCKINKNCACSKTTQCLKKKVKKLSQDLEEIRQNLVCSVDENIEGNDYSSVCWPSQSINIQNRSRDHRNVPDNEITNTTSGNIFFRDDGSFTIPTGINKVTVTVVGGGGGGGAGFNEPSNTGGTGSGGGGGGSGELHTLSLNVCEADILQVIIGDGGIGGTYGGPLEGQNGSPTIVLQQRGTGTIGAILALGGGGGQPGGGLTGGAGGFGQFGGGGGGGGAILGSVGGKGGISTSTTKNGSDGQGGTNLLPGNGGTGANGGIGGSDIDGGSLNKGGYGGGGGGYGGGQGGGSAIQDEVSEPFPGQDGQRNTGGGGGGGVGSSITGGSLTSRNGGIGGSGYAFVIY